MISVSIIFSTGEKKWMPMNFDWSLNSSASELIGSVEVLEAKIAPSLEQRLRLGVGLGLDLAVLEHGLDDEIAILEGVVVGGRGDARHRGVAVLLAQARPFLTRSSITLCACALPLSAEAWSRSISTTSMPARAET